MMGFVIALISGALMSIQGVFNTEVTKQTSIWVSAGCNVFEKDTDRCLCGAVSFPI